MTAAPMPSEAVAALAAAIDTPALLRALQGLQEAGYLRNQETADGVLAGYLRRLTELGLADAGYSRPADEEPFVWVSNARGRKVLEHLRWSDQPASLDSRLRITSGARSLLGSLTPADRAAVLTEAETLAETAPDSWPREKVTPHGTGGTFLLRVPPELCAFVRPIGPEGLELSDIMSEDMFEAFQEAFGGSKVG